jgi:hypothetical protein
LGEANGARIVSDGERRSVGISPQNPLLVELENRLKAELGPETELRFQPRLQLLWIKLVAGDRAYWAGYQLPPRPSDEVPERAAAWSLIILAVLLVSAFAFARYLARPLRELNDAVASVGRTVASPLPGRSVPGVVTLNQGFGQMLSEPAPDGAGPGRAAGFGCRTISRPCSPGWAAPDRGRAG